MLRVSRQTGIFRHALYWPDVEAPAGCGEHPSLCSGCVDPCAAASLVKTCLGFRLCRGVCARSAASQAPDVLGHIWTKQHTVAMHLVPQSSTKSLALTFKWDGKACRQKEPDPEILAWLLAMHQSGAGNSGWRQWGEHLGLLLDPHQATGDSTLWRSEVAGKSLKPLGTTPAWEEASSEG